MVVCASLLWHVGTKTLAGVGNHPHLKKMAFSFLVTEKLGICFALKFNRWFASLKKKNPFLSCHSPLSHMPHTSPHHCHFPFPLFPLCLRNTSGVIYACTQRALQTQHPSGVPHPRAVRLPVGVLEVIPSCSGTARWCCWSAAPSHGGRHPAHAPRTRSLAGPTAAGEGFGPSGWWVAPRRLEWGFPQSEEAVGSPVQITNKGT